MCVSVLCVWVVEYVGGCVCMVHLLHVGWIVHRSEKEGDGMLKISKRYQAMYLHTLHICMEFAGHFVVLYWGLYAMW